MKGCFIGPMPGFENANLFSEYPIIAILETEGPSQKLSDGTTLEAGAGFKVHSFDQISRAVEFRKQHESPDNVTKVRIYAFANGEWRLVRAIAHLNQDAKEAKK